MARLRFGNPCPGYSLTVAAGVFGAPRTGHVHEGWDWTAPQGSPVRASAAGKVIRVSTQDVGAAGLLVELDHGSGWTSFYCHLSKVLTTVGKQVRAGDLLGEVGHTGNAVGDHLHAAWRLFGKAIDPCYVVEGDAGANVLRTQRRLKAAGFDPGPLDGRFGPRTAAALVGFQDLTGLDTTGLPDEWTLLMLRAVVAKDGGE